MARLIELPTHSDDRGSLTVIEKVLPFDIRRVYYIYDISGPSRAGHGHKRTIQALVCLRGSCRVLVRSMSREESAEEYTLGTPGKVLVLYPEDWHKIHSFTGDPLLLVLSSEHYDPEDYLYPDYEE